MCYKCCIKHYFDDLLYFNFAVIQKTIKCFTCFTKRAQAENLTFEFHMFPRLNMNLSHLRMTKYDLMVFVAALSLQKNMMQEDISWEIISHPNVSSITTLSATTLL